MEKTNKELLAKNRKTALKLGLGITLILIIILYIIINTIQETRWQLIALGISTLVLSIFVVLIGHNRKKQIESNLTSIQNQDFRLTSPSLQKRPNNKALYIWS